MSQSEARRGLVALLDAATPRVREYVLAQWGARGEDITREGGRDKDSLGEKR